MSADDIFAEFAEAKEEAKEEKPAEAEKPVEPKTPAEKPAEKPKPEEKPTKSAEDFFGEVAKAPKEEPKAEEPAPKPTPKPAEEGKFDLSDAKGTGKIVFMLYGLKGHGKTYLAFSLPGKIFCLSFDRKSLPVKEKDFNNDPRITIKDAIRESDKSSAEAYLESCDRTFRYVNALLLKEAKKQEPDWIMIDGSDKLAKICEMTMRYRNNLMPFQGIANRNLWKERNLYLDQIHNLSSKIAKRGVIYSAYTAEHKIIKEGEPIILEDIPKWIGDIMMETDVVIKVEAPFDKSGKRFWAIIESSKTKRIPTGLKKDVTDVGMKALVGE